MDTTTQKRDYNELSPHANEHQNSLSNGPVLSNDAPARHERCCIVTRENGDKAQMLRFVISPSDDVVFDIHQKLPGRGIYILPSPVNVQKAIDKNYFAKSAKQKVNIREDLVEHVLASLKQALINTLCLANRAGILAAGSDQCLDVLRRNQAGLYLTSSPQSSDMRQRIEAKNPSLHLIDYLSDTELGHIIGRPELTHMIVKTGNLCLKVLHWHEMQQKMKR